MARDGAAIPLCCSGSPASGGPLGRQGAESRAGGDGRRALALSGDSLADRDTVFTRSLINCVHK